MDTITIENPVEEFARRFPSHKELDPDAYITFLENVVHAFNKIYIVDKNYYSELEQTND